MDDSACAHFNTFRMRRRLPLSHFGSFSILLIRVSNLVESGMSSLHLSTDFVSLSVTFKLMTLVDAFWPSVRSVTAVGLRFDLHRDSSLACVVVCL